MFAVLHVEQSDLVKSVVYNELFPLGVEYIPVTTADEAYAILNKRTVSLVLVSMVISGDRIEDFIANVKAGANKDTPIFVVTGSSMDEEVKAIINLGISDYILKETLTEDLVNHVENLRKEDKIMQYLRNARIALIDDSKFEQEVTKSLLNGYGAQHIDAFDSGQDMFASKKKFDMYFVDAVLKREFGRNVILRIRRHNPLAYIAVVSSLDNTRTLASVLNAGANDFIAKPLDKELLLAKIKAGLRAFAVSGLMKSGHHRQ